MFRWLKDLQNKHDRLALERELAKALESNVSDVDLEDEFSDLHDYLALERGEEGPAIAGRSSEMASGQEGVDRYCAGRCLDADELCRLAVGDSLDPERKEHLAECKLCQVMVQTATPNEEKVAAMSKVLARGNVESTSAAAIFSASAT